MSLRSLLPRSFRDGLDLHRSAVRRFVAAAGARVAPGALVLDAGAGGAPSREPYAYSRYFAVDDGRGVERWNYRGLSVSADLLRLPFRDGVFDECICTETLEHLTDPGDFLAEVSRVLCPGGRLQMTAPMSFKEHQQPHDYFRYTRYGLRLLLERAGLEVVQVEPEGGYFTYIGDKIQPAHRYLFGKDRAVIWKILFLILHPFSLFLFTVIAPWICKRLDPLDKKRVHTTGFQVIATKPTGADA